MNTPSYPRRWVLAVVLILSSAACSDVDPTSLKAGAPLGADSPYPAPEGTLPGETDAELTPTNSSDSTMEGDIRLEPSAPGVAGIAGNVQASRPWPGGVVPYVIDAALPAPQRASDAMAHWEARTGIRFVPRKAEGSYVAFVDGSGCSSFVGRTGSRQEITLAQGCTTGSAIHEIGHAVGLWHEQSRSDRDQFVTVHLENVTAGMEGNFSKTTFTSLGAYDIGSIMHYGSTYFSKNGRPTLTRLDGSAINPNRAALSTGDIAGANALYAGETAPTGPTTAPVRTATTLVAVNLRGGPGTSYSVLAVLPKGSTVQRDGRSQSGYDAVTHSGRSGWIYARYLTQ